MQTLNSFGFRVDPCQATRSYSPLFLFVQLLLVVSSLVMLKQVQNTSTAFAQHPSQLQHFLAVNQDNVIWGAERSS